MYLVTGGAGFIGSNLVASLSEAGERIVVSDWLGSEDKWRNLAKAELEDLLRPEALPDWLASKADSLSGIFHLGAISATTERDADALVENNFKLSCDLWTAAAKANVPFIYASSAATYGEGAQGFDDEASSDYQAQLRPLNGYGWSKLLFDRWVARRLVLGEPSPPRWAGLKFFNVYGPNEYHKGGQASVAWHLYNQIKAGEPARLFKSHHPDYADGGQLRDFVWVEDCVSVMRWLMNSPKAQGLFNVGSGKARSFADLARAVFTAMERPEAITYIPTPETIRDTYQYFTEAKMDRLQTAGYNQPFLDLEEGIRRYMRDFLLTSDPYR